MKKVKSSNIASVGYEPEKQLMHIEFKTGATHSFRPIAAWEHRNFMAAPSLGSHFAKYIRGRYESKRIS